MHCSVSNNSITKQHFKLIHTLQVFQLRFVTFLKDHSTPSVSPQVTIGCSVNPITEKAFFHTDLFSNLPVVMVLFPMF